MPSFLEFTRIVNGIVRSELVMWSKDWKILTELRKNTYLPDLVLLANCQLFIARIYVEFLCNDLLDINNWGHNLSNNFCFRNIATLLTSRLLPSSGSIIRFMNLQNWQPLKNKSSRLVTGTGRRTVRWSPTWNEDIATVEGSRWRRLFIVLFYEANNV